MFHPLLAAAVFAASLTTSIVPEPSADRTAPVGSPYAGTWAGAWAVGDFAAGTMTIEIAPSGNFVGTVQNLTFGITGTIQGQVSPSGHFTNLAFQDGTPGGISISCGQFEIAANGHLVTTSWGVQESGCNNPGWVQDLTRQ